MATQCTARARQRQRPLWRAGPWALLSALVCNSVATCALGAAIDPPPPQAWVALSNPGDPQSLRFYEAVRAAARLPPGQFQAATAAAESISNDAYIPDARIAVAVGASAATTLCASGIDMPLLLTLILKPTYQNTLAPACSAHAMKSSALFMEQPLARQIAALRLALPHFKRAVVLLGPQTRSQRAEIESLLRGHNLEPVILTVDDVGEIFYLLERVASRDTFLLAVPEPLVFTSKTAPHILLAAYRYGMPVVGYSESYVKAGALLAVYSSPEQLGQQAGEILAQALRSPAVTLPAPQYPKYYSIAVNKDVARSLGLSLPDQSELLAQLKKITGATHE